MLHEREDYFFDTQEKTEIHKVFVLIIYDIENNSRRVKLAKLLQGYGFRVQKSAFEAEITKNKYEKLLRELQGFRLDENDSVRIYKIIGKGQVVHLGKSEIHSEIEDIILI